MNRKKWWVINNSLNKVLKYSQYTNYMSFAVGFRVPQGSPARVKYDPDRDIY